MKHGPIHLHIDELVLHGFDPADRHRIGDAVQRELHALLREGGLPEALRKDLPRIDAGLIHSRPTARPAEFGGQIAQAVYQGFSR